ncbi:RecX family transcriptional regulator [Patescibacteria group bacterium]|nr:RecX family transcriptional regulator [Patescibacteria group bacterium]MBU0776824.1 RecX family transcriptional regulator [Patescibacteria group bacterium]MBU0845601.1 RecX family transcriptional regulator [Patescibacteria group bacterium]MBU0922643.1 RecX family transcriptional regulator [Patescibacteria group bacterium]MBU1066694.1 RecX family transcriptional regulator [Patescibacteria group bacterium]
MPIITALKPQRNKKRVNVYLDDKFSFGIDLENLVKLDLKIGKEYSEKEIKEIIKKAEFQKTYDKIIRYSTLRPRSKREVEMWLRKYKVHESLHEELFNKLKRLELLDDAKFAKWWVDQRMAFRPRGKRALTAELRQKGVDQETIKEVLVKIEIDETKVAKDLLKKYQYKWEKLPKSERKRKISSYLARKGFGWETIKQTVLD